MQFAKDSTSEPIPILLVDETDRTTGLTGASPSVQVKKPGGSFAAAQGSVSEDANGHYSYTPSASEVDTAGVGKIHATASGAVPYDAAFSVVDNQVWGTYRSDNRDGKRLFGDGDKLDGAWGDEWRFNAV